MCLTTMKSGYRSYYQRGINEPVATIPSWYIIFYNESLKINLKILNNHKKSYKTKNKYFGYLQLKSSMFDCPKILSKN